MRTELEQASFKKFLVILSDAIILNKLSPLTTVAECRNPSEFIYSLRESEI